MQRKACSTVFARWIPLTVAVALVAAACGSGAEGVQTPEGPTPPPSGSLVSIPNQGGNLEGHTPRGFAGMGTGLFVGGNLNPSFPDGDGVQAFLTFDLPVEVGTRTKAILTSSSLSERGSPFDDLGVLRAEPVSYESFGPPLFDLEADGPSTGCERTGASVVECDVSDAVVAAISAGSSRVQLRLKFDTPGDGDGQQDLALFFLTDSNTNEPGIFTLELS